VSLLYDIRKPLALIPLSLVAFGLNLHWVFLYMFQFILPLAILGVIGAKPLCKTTKGKTDDIKYFLASLTVVLMEMLWFSAVVSANGLSHSVDGSVSSKLTLSDMMFLIVWPVIMAYLHWMYLSNTFRLPEDEEKKKHSLLLAEHFPVSNSKEVT
jgi:hypothetical protein